MRACWRGEGRKNSDCCKISYCLGLNLVRFHRLKVRFAARFHIFQDWILSDVKVFVITVVFVEREVKKGENHLTGKMTKIGVQSG